MPPTTIAGPRRDYLKTTLAASSLFTVALVSVLRAAPLAPTHADVHYGPDERQVLDFYAAKSDRPAPVAVYIYGGGFVNGDKRRVPAGERDRLLTAGISVAAINYRHADKVPLPAAFHDGARAVQYLRSRATDWNIDKTRIAAWGGSAGAQISMYLGFHDDLADPRSADPIARESTRLRCVGSASGQCTIDPEWMMKFIPGYDKPDRDVPALFGLKTHAELVRALADVAAINLASSDDPPLMMTYGMAPGDPIPADPKKRTGWQVHHVMFGVKLKERMDILEVDAILKYPGVATPFPDLTAFLIAKLNGP